MPESSCISPTSGAGSKLIQYDLDSLNSMDPVTDISATKFDGYTQGTDYGALQSGPDGVIYMAVDNSGTIGTISNTNGDDAGASFSADGFDLQGRTSRLGLPNFAQSDTPPLQTPSMTVSNGCAGQPSSFAGVGRDAVIETYLWVFGDGQSSVDQNATHTYDSAGVYNVQLRLSNRCDVDTILTQTIEIFNLPASPIVPADTALCDQPIVLTAWDVDDPDFTYYWSTGDTTRQITVSNPALIDVAIISRSTGCTSDTLTVFLANAGPTIDLGLDRTICQNEPPPTLDTQVPNATYSWEIDGTGVGSNRTFDILTDTPGTFEYTVEVTNSFGCVGRDTLQVTILEEPDITVVSNPTSGCGVSDGSFDVTLNTAGSYTIEGVGATSFGPISSDGFMTVSVPNLAAGNYVMTTTNIITGCPRVSIIQIDDPGALGLNVTSMGTCDGDVELTLGFGSPPASFDYEVLFSDGTVVASGTDDTVISGLNTGTFSIQVSDNNAPNCVETFQITIVQTAQPAFTFDAIQEICGTSGNVFVTDGGDPGVTYSWSGPGGFTDMGTTVTVSDQGTYTVTADGPGLCPLAETIEVIFNADPIVDVVVSGDPCEGEVVLQANASPPGSYVYSWSDGSQAQQNTITTSGSYTVTIVDQMTSCSVTSSPVDVTIQPTFEVSLSTEADCDNNGNVFLIATTNYFDPSITYEWRNQSGEVLSGTDSIITITLSGLYSVIATNETGTCMATDDFNVAVVPINQEDLILPSRATYCSGDATDPQVDLDPGIWNTYEWRLLPDQTIISTDQVLTVSVEGTYEVTIFNGFTCTTDRVEVVEDCRPVIHAPNAFSPNGNGVNEEFFVFPNDYVDAFEIFIYTRWGEIVYHSDVIDFRWDGFYRGKILPVGTYTYILKFSSSLEPELGTIEQYGSVTLVR